MTFLMKNLAKKVLFLVLNILLHFFTFLSTFIQVLLNWVPTNDHLLAESEKKLLKFLKNKPDTYYTEIGPGFGLNSNKIWTLDFNPKNIKNDLATNNHSIYKRKSLLHQSYKIENHKKPIVFLHGLGSGSAIFLNNFDQIFENGSRRLFAIDILGDLVHSIERWRRAIGLEEKFILLGHEFGGYLSLCYSFYFPDYISHVILCDCYGIPSAQQVLQSRTTSQYPLPFWVKFLNKYIFKTTSPFTCLRWMGPYGFNFLKTTRSDLLEKYKKILKEENADLIINYFYHLNVQKKRSGEIAFKALSSSNGFARYPIIHRVRDLSPDINMTFIFGSRSWVDRQPAFQVKYILGDDRVSVNVIQGAGHLVFADKAEEFNNLIIQICNLVDNYNNSPTDQVDGQEISSLLLDE